jgi:hypothetical protein
LNEQAAAHASACLQLVTGDRTCRCSARCVVHRAISFSDDVHVVDYSVLAIPSEQEVNMLFEVTNAGMWALTRLAAVLAALALISALANWQAATLEDWLLAAALTAVFAAQGVVNGWLRAGLRRLRRRVLGVG